MGRQTGGNDIQSRQIGGDGIGVTGTTSSAPTATTATDSTKSWTTNQWVGHMVVIGSVFGVVISNTATVLTVDMWHNPTLPATAVTGGLTAGETAGATPASGTYVILPGNAPAAYMAISSATRVNTADTFLTNDGTTISEFWASGGGLNRSLASYSHSPGASSFNWLKTYQMVVADGSSVTVNEVAMMQAQVTAAPTTSTSGPMFSKDLVPSAPTLIPGDSTAIIVAVSI